MVGLYKRQPRSEFEKRILQAYPELNYESIVLRYRLPEAKYYADFVHSKHPTLLFEAIERFRDRQECRKYIYIAKDNPLFTLVFILENPLVPMPDAPLREDGSRLTHAEWCDINGFKWCTIHTLPEIVKKYEKEQSR